MATAALPDDVHPQNVILGYLVGLVRHTQRTLRVRGGDDISFWSSNWIFSVFGENPSDSEMACHLPPREHANRLRTKPVSWIRHHQVSL